MERKNTRVWISEVELEREEEREEWEREEMTKWDAIEAKDEEEIYGGGFEG